MLRVILSNTYSMCRYFQGKTVAAAVSEMLGLMHENDLFDTFPECSKVVLVLAVIPATSCSTERSSIPLRRLKTYLCGTMKQQRVSDTALINVTLKGHMPTL